MKQIQLNNQAIARGSYAVNGTMESANYFSNNAAVSIGNTAMAIYQSIAQTTLIPEVRMVNTIAVIPNGIVRDSPNEVTINFQTSIDYTSQNDSTNTITVDGSAVFSINPPPFVLASPTATIRITDCRVAQGQVMVIYLVELSQE